MNLSRALRLLMSSLGISFFVWASFDPRFRNAEGFLAGGFCLPVTIGVAMLVLGCGVSGRSKGSAFWFALALIGQAVALQLIDAGPLIHYQHYTALAHPLLLLCIGGQTVLVAAGFRSRWPDMRACLGRTFTAWQLLAIGLVFFLSSAPVSRAIPVYVAELFFAAFIQVVNLANIILVVWTLPDEVLASIQRRIERCFGQPREGRAEKVDGVDRFAILAAVWVVVLAALLNLVSYERHPHIADEVVYLYHARYLADGMLTLPAPPAPDAFNIDLMHYEDTRWYSPVPPGWPVMLVLGVLCGVPWLVNPLLAGVNILLTSALVREIYNRRTARMAVFLLCISPWHVFMGMNFLLHTFTLTCALVAALGIVWARRTHKATWGWVGGMATGMVSVVRPLDGLVVAGLLGLWAVGVGGQRVKASAIAAFILGCLVVGSAVLPYNYLLTGDPMRFPIMAYMDKYYGPSSNALGFGPERGVGWPLDPFPGHGPLDALINANLNTFSVNIELFGWSTGSLLLIALILFSRTMWRSDYLMLAAIVAVIAAYSLYWFSGGPDFGARYWYLILVPCVVLTVRGMQFLERTFETRLTGVAQADTRVMVAVLALCGLAFANYFPWRAIDKYHHYLGMRPDIRSLSKAYNFGKSVVLIQGERFPDYASAAVHNPVDLRAEVPVYVWDRNAAVRAQALKAYPDRPVWIVKGPTITRSAFKVAAGPLSTHELVAQGDSLGKASLVQPAETHQ